MLHLHDVLNYLNAFGPDKGIPFRVSVHITIDFDRIFDLKN